MIRSVNLQLKNQQKKNQQKKKPKKVKKARKLKKQRKPKRRSARRQKKLKAKLQQKKQAVNLPCIGVAYGFPMILSLNSVSAAKIFCRSASITSFA